MKNVHQVIGNSFGTNGSQFGYVYHTMVYSDTSGKTYHYFGKRERKNFSHAYLGSGVVLKSVVAKCGRHNALVEPIAWANSREELEAIESAWIAKAREQYGTNCLNRHDGGTGGRMPDDSIMRGVLTKNAKRDTDPLGYAVMCEKIRRSALSRVRSPEQIAEITRKRLETRSKKTYAAWNVGIPMTDAAKAKASASLTGKPGPNKGRVFGPETRAKQSAAGKGRKFTQSHVENMRLSNRLSKPVMNVLSGETYVSLAYACTMLNLSYSGAKKKRKAGRLAEINLKEAINV